MTIRELINKLEALPDNMNVMDIDLEKLGVVEMEVDYAVTPLVFLNACKDLLTKKGE